MSDQLIQQIIDIIKSIGDAAVSTGWPIVIKQVYVDATGNAFVALFCLAVIIFGASLTSTGKKQLKENLEAKSSYSTHEYAEAYYWIGITILFIALIAALIFGFEVAARLINPEWYAVKMLLEFLPSGY